MFTMITHNNNLIEIILNRRLSSGFLLDLLKAIQQLCSKKEQVSLLINVDDLQKRDYKEMVTNYTIDYNLDTFEQEFVMFNLLNEKINKIAVIGELGLDEFFTRQVLRFIPVEFKHFPSKQLSEAKGWLAEKHRSVSSH